MAIKTTKAILKRSEIVLKQTVSVRKGTKVKSKNKIK